MFSVSLYQFPNKMKRFGIALAKNYKLSTNHAGSFCQADLQYDHVAWCP